MAKHVAYFFKNKFMHGYMINYLEGTPTLEYFLEYA